MTQEQRNFQNRIIALSIIFSLTAGFIAGGLSSDWLAKIDPAYLPYLGKFFKERGGAVNVQELKVVAQEEQVVRVVKEAAPAVVSIIVSKDLPVIERYWREGNSFEDFFGDTPFFKDFFGRMFQSPEYRQKGTQKKEIGGGTGFIISKDGLILTNKHVVLDEQADYTVLTNDGQRYAAKVLARDPAQDIAIIKIDKNNLSTLRLGDSDKIEIGQTAVAIGNALAEFRNTVSVGVISGLKRSITASAGFGASAEQLEGVIQTDAAINPGNSGGPLLNLAGEAVGINVAVAQGAQSIGFALPINLAKRDIEQVQRQGKISYPYLGVRYVLVTPEIKEKNNLSVDYGALVVRGEQPDEVAVMPGSPADKAELAENDIILEVDGQKIGQDHTLVQIIQNHNVGDTLTLKVLSKGKEKTVKVVLGER